MTTRQLDLLEQLSAREARDESMERVERHAETPFIDLAFDVGMEISRTMPAFSANDVRDEMRRRYSNVETHTDRALGPVMMALLKSGAIERGHYESSGRVRNHHRPVMIWRSLLWMPR